MAIIDKSCHLAILSPMSSPPSDLTSINVSLPRSQREFVECEARRTGCTTTSEYVRRLIADAEKRTAEERLERLLLEGLESGPAEPLGEDFFDRLRERVRSRSQKKPQES